MKKKFLKKNFFVVSVLTFSTFLISALALFLCFWGQDKTPFSLTELPDPAVTVKVFFDNLLEGRYENCDKYLYDFSISGMSEKPKTASGENMLTMLRNSYCYETSGEAKITGQYAEQCVKVTYLDFKLLANAAMAPAKEEAAALNYNGTDIFSMDNAIEIAENAIDIVSKNAVDFYVSSEIIIRMYYDGAEWKILYSNDIEKMLVGNGAN